MSNPEIIVVLEQSKREKGALTKNMVKYDEAGGGNQLRTVYVNQNELLKTYGKLPQYIIVHVLDGDGRLKEVFPEPKKAA